MAGPRTSLGSRATAHVDQWTRPSAPPLDVSTRSVVTAAPLSLAVRRPWGCGSKERVRGRSLLLRAEVAA